MIIELSALQAYPFVLADHSSAYFIHLSQRKHYSSIIFYISVNVQIAEQTIINFEPRKPQHVQQRAIFQHLGCFSCQLV